MKKLIGILIAIMFMGVLQAQYENSYKYVIKAKGGITNTLKGLDADKVDSTKVSGTTKTDYKEGTILTPAINAADQEEGVALADTTGNAEGNYMTRENYVTDISKNNDLKSYIELGSTALAFPLGCEGGFGLYVAMIDSRAYWIMFKVDETITVTGVNFLSKVAGDYTADNFNGVALYSYSTITSTQVAITADSPDIWKTTAETMGTVAFTSTVVLTPGYYKLALVYNTSSESVAPSIYNGVSYGTTFTKLILGNSKILFGYVSSQTALPATEVDTDMSPMGYSLAIWLY